MINVTQPQPIYNGGEKNNIMAEEEKNPPIDYSPKIYILTFFVRLNKVHETTSVFCGVLLIISSS